MTLEMTVSSHFAHALVCVLDQLGWRKDLAWAALSRANRLHAAAGPVAPRKISAQQPTRLSMTTLETLFTEAEQVLGDPLIGLRAGHVFRIANYGQTGSIYAFAQDLRDVIALNARYQKAAIDLGEIGYEQSGDDHIMFIRPHYGAPEREAYHHTMAMVMAAYSTAYQWLSWGSGQAMLRVELPFAEREGAAFLAEDQFRCPVRFSADMGRLVFTAKAMTQPIPTYDAEKRAIAMHKLDDLLGNEVSHLRFVQAVREAMRSCLASGRISAGCLAGRLNLSDADWRKQMKAANISYQSELDSVRQDILGERYANGVSFAVIACDLGYNDQAAFNRAVRRWYGVAPTEWTPQTLKRQNHEDV